MTTPDLLSQINYPAIEELMVSQRPRRIIVEPYDIPLSFTDQIAQILPEKPDAYLVTANSAVPVADAIRAYYEVMGEKTPYIGYIKANRRLARAWRLRHHVSREGLVSPSEEANPLDVIENEKDRLRPLVGGMSCISVVEQYVNKGRTLHLGQSILRELGVIKTPSFRHSNWYHQAEPYGMDLDTVTSNHANKMREIGEKAALLQIQRDSLAA